MGISKINKNGSLFKKSMLKLEYPKNNFASPFYLYENLTSPIIIITPELQIKYLNPAAENFFSKSKKNLLDKICKDEFNCKSHIRPGPCPVIEVLNRGEPVDIDIPEYFDVPYSHVRAFPIKDNNNNILYIGLEDFSEFVKIRSQAEEIESRFRQIVGIAAFAIFVLDKKFIIEFANASASEMLGQSNEIIEGTDFRDYLTDIDVIKFIEGISGLDNLTSSVCYYSDKLIYFGKDNLNVVEMCLTKVTEIDGSEKIYIYLRNITKEIKLQDELKQTNEFLENLINQSADGIIASDTKGNIIIFNESAEKFLGYSADEAINNVHITDIYLPGYAHEVMEMLRSNEYGGIGRMETMEATTINNKGVEVPCDLSAAIIYDKNAKEVATVGIFSDLSARKKMQIELEETQMKLFQSEKMSSLGKLAAGIAHEINNPLGGIMIFANMLLEDMDENDSKREDLERIASESKRCKNIVRGLLEFSRQTGNVMSSVNMNELLEQGMFLLENQAIFHNINIIKEYDRELPFVRCDSARIKQVFINITQNAIDAMDDKGTFTIKTDCNIENNMVEILFTDTGEGIPEDIVQKIFDPFYTTKEVGKGTGLGLSMSYGIIKDHGGNITVKSKVGEGTTFVVELPIDE